MRADVEKTDAKRERHLKAQAAKRRREADRKDMDIINHHADKLNAEAEDVLEYQESYWVEQV